jgi:hypothetical protein
MSHGHYGYKEKKIHRMLKGNMFNFTPDPEAANTWDSRDLPDTDAIGVPARRQAAKSSNIPR